MRAQVMECIQALPDGPLVLVGHSMGGYLAAMAAARLPQRVVQVVLIDSPMVLGWRATGRVTLSLSAYPSGGSWDVEDPMVNRVDLNGWQTAASVIYQATERFSISLRAGMNIGGELELRDGNNNVLANETLESAPFGALNLRWQF